MEVLTNEEPKCFIFTPFFSDRYLYDADFERGFQPWRQDNAGDLQWQIIRGNTPNSESGPTESYITGILM